jgi:hypothetical protein
VQRNHFASLRLLGTFTLILLWVSKQNTHPHTHTHTHTHLRNHGLVSRLMKTVQTVLLNWYLTQILTGIHLTYISVLTWWRRRTSYILLYGVQVGLTNKLGGQGCPRIQFRWTFLQWWDCSHIHLCVFQHGHSWQVLQTPRFVTSLAQASQNPRCGTHNK